MRQLKLLFMAIWALGLIGFAIDPVKWAQGWPGYISVLCAYVLTILSFTSAEHTTEQGGACNSQLDS